MKWWLLGLVALIIACAIAVAVADSSGGYSHHGAGATAGARTLGTVVPVSHTVAQAAPGATPGPLTITNDTGQPASDLYLAEPDAPAIALLGGYLLTVKLTANAPGCPDAQIADQNFSGPPKQISDPPPRGIARVSWPSRCVQPGDSVTLTVTAGSFEVFDPSGLRKPRSGARLDFQTRGGQAGQQVTWVWTVGRVALAGTSGSHHLVNSNSIEADGLSVLLNREDYVLLTPASETGGPDSPVFTENDEVDIPPHVSSPQTLDPGFISRKSVNWSAP